MLMTTANVVSVAAKLCRGGAARTEVTSSCAAFLDCWGDIAGEEAYEMAEAALDSHGLLEQWQGDSRTCARQPARGNNATAVPAQGNLRKLLCWLARCPGRDGAACMGDVAEIIEAAVGSVAAEDGAATWGGAEARRAWL